MVQLDTGEQYDGNYYVDKPKVLPYSNATYSRPSKEDMYSADVHDAGYRTPQLERRMKY